MSLYYEVMEQILSAIRSKQFSDLIPSEASLCETYNVSNSTIKKALSEIKNLGLIEQLPNGRHKVISLKEGNANEIVNVGFVAATNPPGRVLTGYFSKTAIYIRDLISHDFNLIYNHTDFEPALEKQILEKFISMKVQGLFALPMMKNGELINIKEYETLYKIGTAVVFLIRDVKAFPSVSLLVRDEDIMKVFFRQLENEGCNEIVMISSLHSTPGLIRRKIFSVLYEDKLGYKELCLNYRQGLDTPDNISVIKETIELLGNVPKGTKRGIWFENDYMLAHFRKYLDKSELTNTVLISDGAEKQNVYEHWNTPIVQRDYNIFNYPSLNYCEYEIASRAVNIMEKMIRKKLQLSDTIAFEPHFANC